MLSISFDNFKNTGYDYLKLLSFKPPMRFISAITIFV